MSEPQAIHQPFFVFGRSGAPVARPGNYQMTKSAVKPTEMILSGAQNVYADFEDRWYWLPQYHCSTGAPVGKTKPLVVFLVSGPLNEIASYTTYNGQSGVYWCPTELRHSFLGDKDIIWLTGGMGNISTSHDPIRLVARRVCKLFRRKEAVKSFLSLVKMEMLGPLLLHLVVALS